MHVRKIQFLFSLIFLIGYILLISVVLLIEASDSLNMIQGDNSMMDAFKILLGVLTAGVGQILNFWFNDLKKFEISHTQK